MYPDMRMILQIIISNGISDSLTGILAKISLGTGIWAKFRLGTGIWYPPSRPSLLLLRISLDLEKGTLLTGLQTLFILVHLVHFICHHKL